MFYREFFSRIIDETPLAKLYAAIPSRPNVPVNVLAGFGGSDEQMGEAFCFDLFALIAY